MRDKLEIAADILNEIDGNDQVDIAQQYVADALAELQPAKVYVVLFHDVWDNGNDPGVENENGEPETTSIERIFAHRAAAEDLVASFKAPDFNLKASHSFFTIEEWALDDSAE